MNPLLSGHLYYADNQKVPEMVISIVANRD